LIDDSGNRVRIGYNVNKKIGRSTVRNLIKRRAREIFRNLKKDNRASFDVLFIAKKPITNAGFTVIKDQIDSWMKDYLG
jgi:ribonuclease P protein component